MTHAFEAKLPGSHSSRTPACGTMRDARPNGVQREITAAQSAYGNQAVLRTLQRKCDGCGQAGEECTECREKREASLQRAGAGTCGATMAPPIVSQVLRSPGQPLDAPARSYMERSFGRDFSPVRVHTDETAAASARQVNARAYTVGRDVVFGAGQYAPHTAPGRKLLAHELAHVVQQRSAGLGSDIAIGEAGDAREQEADRAAERIGTDSPAQAQHSLTGARLQRQDLTRSDGRSACVIRDEIPAAVTPVINRHGQIRQTFQMNVDWRDDPPASKQPGTSYCDCACGEYRQYVKGHLIINGNRETEYVWGGAVIEENVYHEDGIEGAPAKRYGHRDEPLTMNEEFLPDRAGGCSYRGKDAPGVFIGDQIDVLKQFKGQTYDRCNNTFGPVHEWEFRFVGRLNYGP